MTTIVDEFTNGMSADTARANMRAVVEAYGYDGSGNAGDVRAFANTLLVPAGRSIGAAELGGGLRSDWNLLRNPPAAAQAMLDLIAGSQHFPILPSTVFSDDAGTTPAVIGGPVGAVRDMNGDVVATATGAARPTFGVHPASGVRNRFWFNMANVSTNWGVTNLSGGAGVLTVVDDTAEIAALGLPTGVRAYRLDNSAGTGVSVFRQGGVNPPFSSLADFNISAFIRSESGPLAGYALRTGFGGYPDLPEITTSYVRYGRNRSERIEGSENAGDSMQIRIPAGAVALIVLPQNEAGLTMTAPQAVRANGLDVTETGQRPVYYLFDDNVDDVMNATIASELTDATIAWASDAGYTIQTGQTIADGSYNVLRDNRLYGFAIAGTDLSAGQTSLLEKSLKWAGGIAL
jgi:hypothetical protein